MTDDGPALNAAADAAFAAGGGVVRLSCGVYFAERALLLDDRVTLEGDGPCSVLKRGPTAAREPDYVPGVPCTRVADHVMRNAIRNRRNDCSGANITLRNFVVDGSAITSMPCTSCSAQGPTWPSMMIVLSGVTDLVVEDVAILDAPQDGLFVKNGGVRTSIDRLSCLGHNTLWGNGACLNMEWRTNGANPGAVYVNGLDVVSDGPSFCNNDYHLPCDEDADCASVGGPCNDFTSGNTVMAASFVWVDPEQIPPRVILRDAYIETTDRHIGISTVGCQGCEFTDSLIVPYDSGTLLSRQFLGLRVIGTATKPATDVLVARNIIRGGGFATHAAMELRGLSNSEIRGNDVSDAGGAGCMTRVDTRRVRFRRNRCVRATRPSAVGG